MIYVSTMGLQLSQPWRERKKQGAKIMHSLKIHTPSGFSLLLKLIAGYISYCSMLYLRLLWM